MKLSTNNSILKSGSHPRHTRGFTLVEILISMTLFCVLLGGIVYANVFGLKMCEMTKTKLERSHDARAAIGKLANEIRSSKSAWIGTVDDTGLFQAKLNGDAQLGDALIIYPTTNTNSYVVYFLNSSDSTFRRFTSTSKVPIALAGQVTNSPIFRMQDYSGNVLTNWQINWVINMKLEFFQPREFSPDEYYKLETAVTRRVTGT